MGLFAYLGMQCKNSHVKIRSGCLTISPPILQHAEQSKLTGEISYIYLLRHKIQIRHTSADFSNNDNHGDNINITPEDQDSYDTLSLEVTAQTYRYLDEEAE